MDAARRPSQRSLRSRDRSADSYTRSASSRQALSAGTSNKVWLRRADTATPTSRSRLNFWYVAGADAAVGDYVDGSGSGSGSGLTRGQMHNERYGSHDYGSACTTPMLVDYRDRDRDRDGNYRSKYLKFNAETRLYGREGVSPRSQRPMTLYSPAITSFLPSLQLQTNINTPIKATTVAMVTLIKLSNQADIVPRKNSVLKITPLRTESPTDTNKGADDGDQQPVSRKVSRVLPPPPPPVRTRTVPRKPSILRKEKPEEVESTPVADSPKDSDDSARHVRWAHDDPVPPVEETLPPEAEPVVEDMVDFVDVTPESNGSDVGHVTPEPEPEPEPVANTIPEELLWLSDYMLKLAGITTPSVDNVFTIALSEKNVDEIKAARNAQRSQQAPRNFDTSFDGDPDYQPSTEIEDDFIIERTCEFPDSFFVINPNVVRDEMNGFPRKPPFHDAHIHEIKVIPTPSPPVERVRFREEEEIIPQDPPVEDTETTIQEAFPAEESAVEVVVDEAEAQAAQEKLQAKKAQLEKFREKMQTGRKLPKAKKVVSIVSRTAPTIPKRKQKTSNAFMSDDFNLDLDDSDWYSKYCIIQPQIVDTSRAAFREVDTYKQGWLSISGIMRALRLINSKIQPDQEKYMESFLRQILKTEAINLSLFTIIAALSTRIATLDQRILGILQETMDKYMVKAVDDAWRQAMALWRMCMTATLEPAHIDLVCIELHAGGISTTDQETFRRKMLNLNKQMFDFIDFLIYLPLFIMTHNEAVNNPITV